MDKKLRVSIIRLIRKELQKEKSNWHAVEHLCDAAELGDTAFWEKIKARDKKATLSDFLLSIKYHKTKKH